MPPCTFPIHTKTFYCKIDTNFIYKFQHVIKKFFDEYIGCKYVK